MAETKAYLDIYKQPKAKIEVTRQEKYGVKRHHAAAACYFNIC